MLFGPDSEERRTALVRMGLDKRFVARVTQVSEAPTPGSLALFIIVRGESNPNAVMAALRPYKGEVYHTSLAPEAGDAVRSALKGRT